MQATGFKKGKVQTVGSGNDLRIGPRGGSFLAQDLPMTDAPDGAVSRPDGTLDGRRPAKALRTWEKTTSHKAAVMIATGKPSGAMKPWTRPSRGCCGRRPRARREPAADMNQRSACRTAGATLVPSNSIARKA